MDFSDLDAIIKAVGGLVSASTALMLALQPLIKMVNEGKIPAVIGIALKSLDRLAGIFAVNGKPVGRK